MIGGLIGILIITCFVAEVLYIKHKMSIYHRYRFETLSGIIDRDRMLFLPRVFCYVVAVLIFPFTYFVIEFFDVSDVWTFLVIAFIASIGLIGTAITLNNTNGMPHQFLSLVFYSFLLMYQLPVAVTSIYEGGDYEFLGYYGFAVYILAILIVPIMFIYYNNDHNYIKIAFLMTLNILWVSLFALLVFVLGFVTILEVSILALFFLIPLSYYVFVYEPNGLIEVIFMGLNASWVIIFSIIMIIV